MLARRGFLVADLPEHLRGSLTFEQEAKMVRALVSADELADAARAFIAGKRYDGDLQARLEQYQRDRAELRRSVPNPPDACIRAGGSQ
jgi:hypothetical protein